MRLMDAARSGDDVVFRTSFSGDYDLVQVFRGMNPAVNENHPVDFRLAALQRRDHRDIWHMDHVLSFATDECPPVVINGEDIGGNHGHPCAVRVRVPAHGLDVRDVGSLWTDDDGISFTLLRVESADSLLLLSENLGPSPVLYDFAEQVSGRLHHAANGFHGYTLRPESQRGHVQLTPAIRHRRREALCLRDGQWAPLEECCTGCECAEIREEYDIVNPATVARAIRESRPTEGYAVQPSLARGETMLRHRVTYRVCADGTVLCDFDHRLTQDVHLSCCLGSMHQEPCDAFGGGVWQYIPKLRPFDTPRGRLDFSRPCRADAATMPDGLPLTPDKWAVPSSPPDRQLDFFRRPDGSSPVALATGFLPLYDGAPEKRASAITDAGMLVSSCKTYPTFAGGADNIRHPHRESAEGTMRFTSLRGIAYRKYFAPCGQDACVFDIPCGEERYVYMDCFGDAPRQLRYDACPGAEATLLEASATCRTDASRLWAEADSGYAVFRLKAAQRKE
ncbi:MAG: hypothetical protein ACI4O7_08420 [Aristaeellaceae bacterium]